MSHTEPEPFHYWPGALYGTETDSAKKPPSPPPTIPAPNERAYLARMNHLKAEHKMRIVRLAVCAELYRRFNATQEARSPALELDIGQLTRRWQESVRP